MRLLHLGVTSYPFFHPWWFLPLCLDYCVTCIAVNKHALMDKNVLGPSHSFKSYTVLYCVPDESLKPSLSVLILSSSPFFCFFLPHLAFSATWLQYYFHCWWWSSYIFIQSLNFLLKQYLLMLQMKLSDIMATWYPKLQKQWKCSFY